MLKRSEFVIVSFLRKDQAYFAENITMIEQPAKENFVDVLAMEIHYAVLTKGGRIQVLVKPSPKELRKRGRRGWHLFGTVDSDVDAHQLLVEKVQQALTEMEGAQDHEEMPRKKAKKK